MKAWISTSLGPAMAVAALAKALEGEAVSIQDARGLTQPGVMSWKDFRDHGDLLMACKMVVVCDDAHCRSVARHETRPSVCFETDLLDEVQAALDCPGQRISPAAALQALHFAGPAEDMLTERERQVAVLTATSHSIKQIASCLGVAFKTADTHRHNINKKLGLHDSAAITRWAIRSGLVEA